MFCARATSGHAADEWLLSDGHCETLMRSGVNEVGLGVGHYTVMPPAFVELGSAILPVPLDR